MQVVILAGGLATRLGYLTEERPKPMVEIRGKPFLEYQLELLKEAGIKKALGLKEQSWMMNLWMRFLKLMLESGAQKRRCFI